MEGGIATFIAQPEGIDPKIEWIINIRITPCY